MRTLRDDGGAAAGILGSLRDISARKAAEEAVQASEALFRGVFDHTTDGILVYAVGRDGAFTLETYNLAAAEALGVAVGELSGRSLDEAIPGSHAALVKPGLEDCVAGREVVELGDAVAFGVDRRTRDVTVVPILGEGGRVIRVVVTGRDTTDRKLAENLVRESAARYRLIANNVADLVVRLGGATSDEVNSRTTMLVIGSPTKGMTPSMAQGR